MLNLIRAEWLKLARRPMSWVLLIVFLLVMLLFLGIEFLAVALHEGLLFGGTIQISLEGPMVRLFRHELQFPGIFGGVLGQINSIGGVCAVILAAGALGSEYNWGTLRVQLARQPDRGRFLIAKTLALLSLVLVGMAIALLVGALAAWGFGSILGNTGSIGVRDLLLLPIGMLRALYVMLPYILFTLAVCVIGRSVFVGVAGGLIFIGLDNGINTLNFLTELGNPLVTFLVNLPLQQNANALLIGNRTMYGFDASTLPVANVVNLATLPSPLQATIMVAIYSALFFGYAYYMLTRRDIGGAT
jgi:ABC-type transport system involved in multi-copper enzyme maturation permease subunit